jgi:hypothetical protein
MRELAMGWIAKGIDRTHQIYIAKYETSHVTWVKRINHDLFYLLHSLFWVKNVWLLCHIFLHQTGTCPRIGH